MNLHNNRVGRKVLASKYFSSLIRDSNIKSLISHVIIYGQGDGLPTTGTLNDIYLAIGGGHRQPEHFSRLSC